MGANGFLLPGDLVQVLDCVYLRPFHYDEPVFIDRSMFKMMKIGSAGASPSSLAADEWCIVLACRQCGSNKEAIELFVFGTSGAYGWLDGIDVYPLVGGDGAVSDTLLVKWRELCMPI